MDTQLIWQALKSGPIASWLFLIFHSFFTGREMYLCGAASWMYQANCILSHIICLKCSNEEFIVCFMNRVSALESQNVHVLRQRIPYFCWGGTRENPLCYVQTLHFSAYEKTLVLNSIIAPVLRTKMLCADSREVLNGPKFIFWQSEDSVSELLWREWTRQKLLSEQTGYYQIIILTKNSWLLYEVNCRASLKVC